MDVSQLSKIENDERNKIAGERTEAEGRWRKAIAKARELEQSKLPADPDAFLASMPLEVEARQHARYPHMICRCLVFGIYFRGFLHSEEGLLERTCNSTRADVWHEWAQRHFVPKGFGVVRKRTDYDRSIEIFITW